MIFYTCLAVSLSMNILFLWYIRQVLINHRDLGQLTNNILKDLKRFEGHLKTVYDLDRFFGDATLSGLLEHVSDLRTHIKKYREFFVLEENIKEGIEDENEEEEEEE